MPLINAVSRFAWHPGRTEGAAGPRYPAAAVLLASLRLSGGPGSQRPGELAMERRSLLGTS